MMLGKIDIAKFPFSQQFSQTELSDIQFILKFFRGGSWYCLFKHFLFQI